MKRVLKKYYVLLFLFYLISFGKTIAQRDTAKVGIFVVSLYNFDLTGKSYTSDFWIWFNHKNDSLSFENSVEITNSIESEFSMYMDELKGDIHWVTEKCHATMRAEWDISDFPFDRQILTIEVEEGDKDTTDLIYVADVENSKIDPNVKLNDWRIMDFKVVDAFKTYNTTYGDPELSDVSVYPMIRAEITLKRLHVWTIFFKIFTGVFVGFLISLFVFFIKPINVDPRFGLCVGGLFAAVGNKYVVESMVSSVSINSLIDIIHNITFISILFVIVISILSLWIYEKGGEKNTRISRLIDLYSFIIILLFYIGLTIYFVKDAMIGHF